MFTDIKGAGSHWGLIVVEKHSKNFYYYDSMGSVISNAKTLCDKISKFIFKDKVNFL